MRKPKMNEHPLFSILKDGQEVEARFGFQHDDKVEWQGGWKKVILGVDARGDGSIGVKNMGWADMGPQDYHPPNRFRENGSFLVEEYLMEIKGLTYGEKPEEKKLRESGYTLEDEMGAMQDVIQEEMDELGVGEIKFE